MAKKQRDVYVVPYFGDALGPGEKFRRSGGVRVLPGTDIAVVSACAGPEAIDGMRVGAIFVDEANLDSSNPNRQKWCDEVVEVLMMGQNR